MKLLLLGTLAAGLLAAPSARAEEEGPCKADMEKFCKDVKPGEGRIMRCMKEHEAELSEGCKKKAAEKREGMGKMKQGAQACKADVEKFCKDVKPGEGRIIACLKSHEAELSEACKAEKGKQHSNPKMEACKADMEKLCKGVEPGEGRVMKCMKEHEAELSEGCKKAAAEGHEAMEKMRQGASDCKADMEKFCKDVKPGEGRVMKCLKEHEAELSDACKAHKGKGTAEKKEAHEDKKEGK